jgi:hypothetical protein
MRLGYTVRLADLFWMWLTSWMTLATIAFGLFFISVLLVPGDYPRPLDVAAGIFLIVSAFTVAPLFWIRVTGMSALVDQEIVLVLDETGVGGWPIAIRGGRPWTRLHRPRIESRVVVLPFRLATSALGWVVIPRSALTDEQLEGLVELLRSHGFLARGDGRSLLGRLLAPFLGRANAGDTGGVDR